MSFIGEIKKLEKQMMEMMEIAKNKGIIVQNEDYEMDLSN